MAVRIQEYPQAVPSPTYSQIHLRFSTKSPNGAFPNLQPTPTPPNGAGQRVKVKVTTYDFARYGAIYGELRSVSATSFLNEKGEPYFKADIALGKNHVGDDPALYVVTPGMTVQTEIITGNKTLLQYMLKPIFTQMQQSFHER